MKIIVEILFYKTSRKFLPKVGYRPDIYIPEIPDSYWGITFTKLSINSFDTLDLAVIKFTFQESHYSEIKMNQSFFIMEGSHKVGYGVFLELIEI